ncbi:hypothetical protein BCD67_23805 [Oscillatoriales cyanobacterium USR001]|nr:hypothetical protein BCD67_23805 [Oscillatoriales cyanobacterium USR001]
MNASQRNQARLLSEAMSNFDTALEQEPQRIIQYQLQTSQPHTENLPVFPALPLSAWMMWFLLLLVHFLVLWRITKK